VHRVKKQVIEYLINGISILVGLRLKLAALTCWIRFDVVCRKL